MKFSQMLIPTLREAPADAEVKSHQLMLRAGFIKKVASGIYTYLPLALRVLQNISDIIRQEMNKSGAQEITMPMVIPAELWQESGRWAQYGDELLRIKDRHQREFCLGPTHEEVVTDLVRQSVRSYKKLPLNLYQIQTKFRDERRPRFGLMRGREFIMKDAYSFHVNEEDALKTYQVMRKTYDAIIQACGLNYREVEADNGAMGGSYSHEFQVLAQSGEDALMSCDQCSYGANIEKANNKKAGDVCDHCKNGHIVESRGIEVGHVFYLGDKYAKALKAFYLDAQGKEQCMQMGCYGIGVSRLAAAAIEQSHDEAGMIWPKNIAPFDVEILTLQTQDEACMNFSENLYQRLKEKNKDVLWDEREESPGVKFKDADLIGLPYQIIVGAKGLKENLIEIKNRKTKQVEKINSQDVEEYICKVV